MSENEVSSSSMVPAGAADLDNLPITGSADAAKLDKLAGSGFLPYVQLIGSSSGAVKEGKMLPGRWTFNRGRDKMEELSPVFECLVLSRRACAKHKTNKGILSFYDQDHPEYKKIEHESKAGGMNGYWHGTEYLGWYPGFKEFFAYHASNPTARSASKDLNTILKAWEDALKEMAVKPKEQRVAVPNPQVKFACTLVPYSNGNKQWGPVFTRATTPFSVLPKWSDVLEQCEKFSKPPTSKVETAPVAAAGSNEEMG